MFFSVALVAASAACVNASPFRHFHAVAGSMPSQGAFTSSATATATATASATTMVTATASTAIQAADASSCTPAAGGSSSIDDTPAIQSAIAACPSGTIVIPQDTTYHINSQLSFTGCAGCTLQVEGTLLVSDDTDYWNGVTAIFLAKDLTGLTVTSTTGAGLFDGNGQASWDLFAADSTYARPTLFYVDGCTDVALSNLAFHNAPSAFLSSTGGSAHVAYSDITLTAVSTSANAAKNTDGWDIGESTYVTVTRATVTNDDDCVAFKPGARYVEVYDVSCNGSHGISVGSLGSKAGQTDTVENILVRGATMINSAKASGFKLYPGGADYGAAVISNVTWEDFVVDDSDYAFQVQSCYNGDAAYCAEYPSAANITDVVVKGYSGTTSTAYAPAVANIDCPADGTCGIVLSNMTVEAGSGTAEYLCANTPSDLGVTCTDGASG